MINIFLKFEHLTMNRIIYHILETHLSQENDMPYEEIKGGKTK